MIPTFASRLKQLRLNKNLRQEQVANLIGVNKSAISNRIHIFMDTLRSIGSPKRICFMIEENGRTLLIAPYAQKDFKSHEVPDSVYAGSSSLEINSLRLCSLVAKLHGWDRERSYRVPGKYSTEHNVVIFRLYEAEIIERLVSS